jgi:hypothetical protein
MKTALVLALVAAAGAAAIEPLTLTGAYAFTTTERDAATAKPVCSETWTFGPGDDMTVHSGEEIVRKKFRTAHDRDGHWLIMRSVATNGAPDCTGRRTAEPNPNEARVLLLPFKDGTMMTCPPPAHTKDGTPLIADCFATLAPVRK